MVENGSMNTIYTIGYGSWRSLQKFIKFLKELEIGLLVDVRRFPRSKNPEFERENLEAELKRHGMRYEFMGESLGGYRRGGYQKHTETEVYKEGIERLLEMARESNLVIMCLERSHKYCHRRFIAETLTEMGVKVIHLETRAKA
ncbi:MAG: DUF488 family protein [Candidatus Bathyarchaeia archaeon]